MSQTGPWSVKGIDQRARDAAREAAHAEGITLGEYLNRLLMSVEPPRPNEVAYPFENRRPAPNAANDTLDKLTRRIEATEARSTLAITGMDHTILGLVARLEDAEDNASAVAGRVDGLIEELQETYAALQDKVRKLEEDDGARENLDALKSLEQALGKLASHVFEENELAQNEVQAIKGRVETGFSELTDRVEGMEVKVEKTLSDAATRVETAVNEAELRAEGKARDLADRLSDLETHVNLKLSAADASDERLARVEARVTGSLQSLENTLAQTQDRLNRAESTTDAALLSLESTFNSLDEKIDTLSKSIEPDLASKLRAEFETRFDEIMANVRSTVDTTRHELAEEISRAAANTNEGALETLKADLEEVRAQVSTGHERQTSDMDKVSSEIERIGGMVGDRMEAFGEQLDERVNASEQRTAEAISQIGDQVASVAGRLQARQDKALQTLATEIDENRKRAEANLSDAINNMSDRLERMQTQTSASLSPVQKAMASLATRLEQLEDSMSAGSTTDPDPLSTSLSDDFVATADLIDTFESDPSDADFLMDETESSFEPGLPEADEVDNVADEFEEIELASETADENEDEPVEEVSRSSAYTEDFALSDEDFDEEAGLDDAEDDFYEPFPEETETLSAEESDPFDDLGVYDDSHTEARESDIFEDDEFDLAANTVEDPAAFFEPDTETESEEAPDADTVDSDYMDMARKAAIAASSGRSASPSRQAASPERRAATDKPFGGRLPLYAAASAVVITGAAVGGYLYLRGKQDPAPVAALPGTEIVLAATAEMPEPQQTAEIEEGMDAILFDEDAAATTTETEIEDSTTAATEAAAMVDAVDAASVQPPKLAAAQIVPAPAYAPIPEVASLEAESAAGNAVAEYQLAQQYLADGNLQEGADLMRRAAEQNLPIAQYMLSKLHERGTGVPKDLTLAREWTEKAAIGGNVKAMHDLAVFMAEGDGGPQTYAGAVEWFRKGAEYGIVDSQYNLGVLYEQGLGISQNNTEALYWFMIAARNGDAGAPAKVMELKAKVAPEAAALAQSQSDSWTPSRANGPANGRFGLQAWDMGNPAQVMATQIALKELGYGIDAADGDMGPQTAGALREFQKVHALPVTGTITPDVIETLNAKVTG